MDNEAKCVLGAVNEQKVTVCEKRLDKLEKIQFRAFSTSMGTLLTAIIILVKELI